MARYLRFKLNKESYFLNIEDVHSIIEYNKEEIRPLPNTDPSILGLYSLRGDVILIMDTLYRLYKKSCSLKETNIVVVNIEDVKAGLMVDEVLGVVEVDGTQFQDNAAILIKSPFFDKAINYENKIEILMSVKMLFDFDIHQYIEGEKI